MRTTLKRGLGRAAAPDGNGRSVLPPGVHSPVNVYRQLPPRRRSRMGLIGQVALWLGVASLVIVAGAAGGAYLYFHESVAAVAAKDPAVKRAARALQVPLPGQPAVALMIGYDHRLADGKGAPSRSDTLMLVRADPSTDSISLLSFPRDMRVEIRCPGRQPYFDKIAHAYQECGPQGSLNTVKALTGLQVNYLITVNFRGFRQIVDRLGGAWIDVDRRYFNDRSGPSGYATINLRPGYQQLTGRRALDFVRYRHTDSDLYRVARQQQFVKAFKTQIQSTFKPLALPKVVNAITKNVAGRAGGWRRRARRDGALLCAVRLRAPARSRLSDEDRGARGLHRSHDRLVERHAGRPDVHASGRRFLGQRHSGRTGGEGQAQRSRSTRHDRDHPERERRRRLGVHRRVPARRAWLSDPHAAERVAGERAAIRLLPHSGLLRAGEAWSAAGRGEGRESLRLGRAEAPAGEHLPARQRCDAYRRRRPDLPRQPGRVGDRSDPAPPAPERRVRPERVPRPPPRAAFPRRLPADGADGDRAELVDRRHDAHPHVLDRPAEEAQGRSARLRHGLERVLGRPDDGLGGRARRSPTRATRGGSRAGSTISTTTARSCTWSSCARSTPATGSSTRCSTASRTRRCWRSPRA